MARNPQPRRNDRQGSNQPRRKPRPRNSSRDAPPPRRHSPPSRRASPSRYNDGPRNDRYSQNQSDSWRPNDSGPRGGYDRRDHYRDRDSRDEYRPNNNRFAPPQSDFSFRMDKPAGIGSYEVGSRPDRRNGPNGRDRKRPDRRPDRPRWRPPPPSERQLLSTNMANMPEERFLTDDGQKKFRNLDELSDDDELAMDISSRSSDSEGDQEPSTKRVKLNGTTSPAADAPKWSNPDPYTALPCPEETTGKKRDVVKLIRKARVEATTDVAAATTTAEDFISFDTTDDEEEEEDDDDEEDEAEYEPAPPTEPLPPLPPGPPPPLPKNPPPPPPRNARDDPLGSRKRTIDDEIKPPDYGQFKQATTRPAKGNLVSAWLPKPKEEPCPWTTHDHSDTTNMAFR